MPNVILSLGSNIKDRKQFLIFGLHSIEKTIGEITKISSIYETEPIGFQSDTNFYNICIVVQSELIPEDILYQIEKIEKASGREYKSQNHVYQSRTLDIDIIFIDQLTINSKRLTIPHLHFAHRKFVLLPLNEILPDFKAPSNQKTINQILQECNDVSHVKRLSLDIINNY
jgi:deoxyguanosine kinase